jgi:protein phosphatase
LKIGLTRIVRCALETDCDGFNQLVDEATHLLSAENGRVGNLDIQGRLVNVEPKGQAVIIGDLHGDLESLVDILKGSSFLERMNRNHDGLMIFLGDYGDRGAYSVEIYYVVLRLKLLFPKQVVLMRGNHELFWAHGGQDDLAPSPHDMPLQFQARFGERGDEAYGKIRNLFEHLYSALLVQERYLMIHGGLSEKARKPEDFAYAHASYPEVRLLEDILWSDPDDSINGVRESPRGAGKLFGENVTENVLGRFGVKILIRGHEPCEEGYKINHSGRVLTLFSSKGSPYFNSHGAYLEVDLSRRFDNAKQLVPYTHKF